MHVHVLDTPIHNIYTEMERDVYYVSVYIGHGHITLNFMYLSYYGQVLFDGQ